MRWIPLSLWLAASVAFVVWSLGRTYHVGQMVLPKSQVAALSITISLVVGLLLCWTWLLLRLISRRLGLTSRPSLFDRRAVRYPLLALLVLCPLELLYGRYVEPRWVAVRTVHLGAPRTDRRGIRVAVISDLHVDRAREPFTSLAARVNATDPDLILLLGDTLNRGRALPVLRRVLRRMKARHGKYAVHGNWENWYWHDLPLLKGTGFSWLHRRRVTRTIRGQRIHLAGLPFANRARGAPAERLLRRVPDGWRLFLYHTPDLAGQVPSADLYLAGHTHGGQIAIPFFGALVTLSRYGKRFERGLYRVGDGHLYVNPGIGVEPMVPLRIGVRPEVTLFVLGRAPGRSL